MIERLHATIQARLHPPKASRPLVVAADLEDDDDPPSPGWQRHDSPRPYVPPDTAGLYVMPEDAWASPEGPIFDE